jgi:hypothetical protein
MENDLTPARGEGIKKEQGTVAPCPLLDRSP